MFFIKVLKKKVIFYVDLKVLYLKFSYNSLMVIYMKIFFGLNCDLKILDILYCF